MGLLHRLRARIRNRRFDRDLAEELRFHEEMKREELEAGGVATDDARAGARRALGNLTLMREDSRRVWIAPWFESVTQDVRYALRTLGRQPLHSLTAGLVLVLGIGLSTALFTLFKAMALEPWPARDPEGIVRVLARANGRVVGPSVNEYRFLRDHARSLSGVAAVSGNYPEWFRAEGVPRVSLRATWVSANFFHVLGVRMHLGGGFIPSDDTDGGARAPLVLSHRAWRSYFASDPGVIGRAVFVDGHPLTVVGVVDEAFGGNGRDVDLWMPMSVYAALNPQDELAWDPSPGSAACCIGLVGRLAAGFGRQEAARELQLLHGRFATTAARPAGQIELFGTSALDGPGAQRFAVFGALSAAIALILVLACANVGNLQLARGLARRREIATRLSIGASRGRIVRQMLTEAMVLALGAGVGAVGIALALPGLVFRWLDDEIPVYVQERMAPDAEVLLFVLSICTVACLAFALAPALQATRVNIPMGVLDRSATPRGRMRLRGLLLATQIAACTVLLAGAGLLTRAVAHAMHLDLGFRLDGVEMISLQLPSGTSSRERHRISTAVLEQLDAADHGSAVAMASFPPASTTRLIMSMALPYRGNLDHESVLLRPVSSRYFDVLGIPVVRGRMFGRDARDEAVVNEAFARAYWVGEDVVGKTARDVDRKGGVRQTFTIVGVVKDVYLTGLDRIDPVIFTPAQMGVFLTRGGPPVLEGIRAAAVSLNPAATIRTEPLRQSLRNSLAQSRGGAAIAWAVGLLGLALAAVGVFGVFAYGVEERRREIGVRLALGAAGSQIVRMLVATSGRGMVIGLGLGLLLSLACGPVLRSYLFGLHPLDPLAYGGVVALLAATAALATFVPARRACRVDPAITLRDE